MKGRKCYCFLIRKGNNFNTFRGKKSRAIVLKATNHVINIIELLSLHRALWNLYTGLFISLSGISELDCPTTKTDTAERSISIGRESLQVFFILGALAYFQVPPLVCSRKKNGVHSE